MFKIKLKTIDHENWKAKLWNDTGQEDGNKIRASLLPIFDVRVPGMFVHISFSSVCLFGNSCSLC